MSTDEQPAPHPDDDPVDNPDTGPAPGGRPEERSSLRDTHQASNSERVLDPDTEPEGAERAAAEAERREGQHG
jgi:hypothetical protein